MTTLERAFILARSGECSCVAALVRRLDREGHDGHQIHGPLLRKQLADLIKEARKRQPGDLTVPNPHFTRGRGTLVGYTLTMTFTGGAFVQTLTGKVSPDGRVITWSNDTVWVK